MIENEDWSALMAADTGCLATADSGHVLVSRDTSLDAVESGIRTLASPLCCGVTSFESDLMPAEFSPISRPPCRGG